MRYRLAKQLVRVPYSGLRRKKEVRRSSCKAFLARAIAKVHAHAGAHAVAVKDGAELGPPKLNT
jgi:hypothetical protein